jgi:hypothetical protein
VIVTTITSSAPYSDAASSMPARTFSGEPTIVRRPPRPDGFNVRPSRSSQPLAVSGEGTGISWPRRSIVNAIRLEVARNSASSSLGAHSTHTPIAVYGALRSRTGANCDW